MININCPCCHKNINEGIGTVILDNIKKPLNKDCIFCLCQMNSLLSNEKLVSCPKCGNLFHNDCWFEYVNYKHNSNGTLVINSLPTTSNVYNTNRFTYNPNLLQIRTVSEINNLYFGSRLLSNQRPQYIFYPPNHIFIS